MSASANVKAVQQMLGHASAAMTLDVYADLFDEDIDSVATALDQARSAAGVGAPAPEPMGLCGGRAILRYIGRLPRSVIPGIADYR